MHAAPHIPQRPADGLPMPQRLGAILAVAFGVSLSVIDGTVANVALPTIGQQLGISAADSIWSRCSPSRRWATWWVTARSTSAG